MKYSSLAARRSTTTGNRSNETKIGDGAAFPVPGPPVRYERRVTSGISGFPEEHNYCPEVA